MNPKEYVDWFYEKYPHPEDDWTSKKPEHEVLISLITEHDINSVFEIGTWTGYATLLMWLHPYIKRIRSIDKDKNDYSIDTATGVYCRRTSAEVMICSSDSYRVSDKEQYDLIFIDDGHTYNDVKRDTELALKLKPKIIVWHDYISAPGITTYIDEKIAQEWDIKIIPNVNIAYMII